MLDFDQQVCRWCLIFWDGQDIASMIKKRIFISHSRKGEGIPKPVQDVADALVQEGYDAIYDAELLEASDNWYATIAQEMASCDSAIVLIDRPSLESDYIRYETTVLSQRWRVEQPHFKMIIAVIDMEEDADKRLNMAETSKALGPASKIGDTQLWQPDDAARAGGIDGIVAALARKSVEIFGEPIREIGPLGTAIKEVCQSFEKIDARDLLQIASDLAGYDADEEERILLEDSDAWTTEGALLSEEISRGAVTSRALVFSSWLVRIAAEEPAWMVRAVERLGTAIGRLGADRQPVIDYLRIAQSAWVARRLEEDETCQIAELIDTGRATQDEGGGLIALNAGQSRLEYTTRCFPEWQLGKIGHLTIFCDDKTLTLQQVITNIATKVNIDVTEYAANPDDQDLQDELDEDIKDLVGRRAVLCVLPKTFAEDHMQEDILTLRNRFPYILFICHIGRRFEDDADYGLFEPLMPEIDSRTERKQFAHWRTAIGFLGANQSAS